jgi:hypothetical protein
MLVPCQHFPSHAGRDCGRVAASVFADGGIAAYSFGLGFGQLAFARVGLDCHATGGCIFMNVDLDRRATGEVPPGALLAL